MACFSPYAVILVTLLLAWDSNGVYIYTTAKSDVMENTNDNNTDYQNVDDTKNQTVTPDYVEGRCEKCLALLSNLVDEAMNNETGITQKLAHSCLEMATGRNVLINCGYNATEDCPDNRTSEIQRDLHNLCQTDCPSYKTIAADLDSCRQNFTDMEEFMTSGDLTRFCRLWGDQDACIRSATESCGAEMTKLATSESIARNEYQDMYNRLELIAENACNSECEDLDDIHQNASNCVQYIAKELRMKDNLPEESHQCGDPIPCAFEAPIDDRCPNIQTLVSIIHPTYDFSSGLKKPCIKLNVVLSETTKVTKPARPEGKIELAIKTAAAIIDGTWSNVTWSNVTWRNVTWSNVTWRNVTWINVTWRNVTGNTSSTYTRNMSQIFRERTNVTLVKSEIMSPTHPSPTMLSTRPTGKTTTAPVRNSENYSELTPTSPRTTRRSIRTTGRPIHMETAALPVKKTAFGWEPCSAKEKAAVSESTSKTSGLAANHVVIGFTAMLLMVKWL